MPGLLVIGTSSICGGATTHNNRDGFAGNPRMMDPFSNSTFCKSLSYKHNAKSGVARDAPSCFGCNGRSFPQAKCYPPSVEFPGCNKVEVLKCPILFRAYNLSSANWGKVHLQIIFASSLPIIMPPLVGDSFISFLFFSLFHLV